MFTGFVFIMALIWYLPEHSVESYVVKRTMAIAISLEFWAFFMRCSFSHLLLARDLAILDDEMMNFLLEGTQKKGCVTQKCLSSEQMLLPFLLSECPKWVIDIAMNTLVSINKAPIFAPNDPPMLAIPPLQIPHQNINHYHRLLFICQQKAYFDSL